MVGAGGRPCVLSTAFAYATGVTATRRLGSKVASFLGLTEVLASIVVAWLLLGEMPLPVQLVGGVLIVAGVVAVRYDELTHGAPDAGAALLAGGRRADVRPGADRRGVIAARPPTTLDR